MAQRCSKSMTARVASSRVTSGYEPLLRFCTPQRLTRRGAGLGNELQGTRRRSSLPRRWAPSRFPQRGGGTRGLIGDTSGRAGSTGFNISFLASHCPAGFLTRRTMSPRGSVTSRRRSGCTLLLISFRAGRHSFLSRPACGVGWPSFAQHSLLYGDCCLAVVQRGNCRTSSGVSRLERSPSESTSG